MVRLGLALMGYPSDNLPLPVTVQPVLGLKSRIVHIQTVQPGEGISYNHTAINTTGAPMRIATLPLGYADGIPRQLSNKMSVLIQGQRCPQVGIITMDQLMIDITHIDDAQIGDTVTVLGESGGESIRLNDWSALLGTIEYELMCGLRVRLPKTYVR
jgi:alanine racemase